MTSPVFTIEEVTIDTLKSMARRGVFVPQPDDPVRAIAPNAVIYRDTPEDREADSGNGERNIIKPGIIVSYLGSTFPTEAGQNNCDDSRNRFLIQVVDDVPPGNRFGNKTYHYWIMQMRRVLQANPYKAELAATVGDIHLIQVNQVSRADSRRYHLHQQMRAGIEVTAYVREPRT